MKKFDSINFIPFIDIMLVLLAIVLTTSTFIKEGILPVELPHSKSQEKLKHESVIITITKQGELFFEKEMMDFEKIQKAFESRSRQSFIAINCDKSAKFNNFVQVMEMLKSLGFSNISILTEQ